MRSTAEIGLFLLTEGSSASNVRRIEALTGPEAVRHVRFHDRVLHEAADLLRAHTEAVPAAIAALQQKAREAAKARTTNGAVDVSSLVSRAGQVDGAIVTEVAEAPDAKRRCWTWPTA